MKKDTHPTFYENALVTCACGASFAVGSTKEKINVEICSTCHPFFTGKEKVMDTAGRVEKFRLRQERAAAEPAKKAAKPKKAEKKTEEKKVKTEKAEKSK